ncbi:uncharacterized protein [Solanum tuberosum]|uniref:uncharacterized protein n=1 Tax=Solanum tuberosum TaxID=4113 RepID=UPI00073A0E80|nr:PREDICTED: uncharacterized protein LOC107058719 [Solanum tuberosum]
MIFQVNEDKKYIHLCPIALLKTSFDLRPAVNSAIAKYAVVMTPTMITNHIPMSDNPDSATSFYSPMNQPTSFIVWNTRGVNNDNFKRNFKELIKNHNPCMAALLETKMADHLSMVTKFGFDDYWEVPALVLLWHSIILNVTRKKQTPQEMHAMIQVNVEEVGESNGPP